MASQIVSLDCTIPVGTVPDFDSQTWAECANTFGLGARFHVSTHDLMNEFVELLKANRKVWAVAASGDESGIDVWTYIDSSEDADRLPIYEAEWKLMTLYPDVAFDFNTVLIPAGSESFDTASLSYVYRR